MPTVTCTCGTVRTAPVNTPCPGCTDPADHARAFKPNPTNHKDVTR